MQNITIFSLGRNIDSLKEILEKSLFSRKVFYKGKNETDIVLKNRSILNLLFLSEFEEEFFSTKHHTLLDFEDLEAENDLLKFQLVNYIKEAKGVVNIHSESGFDNESFVIVSNLAKLFEGIIYVNGVIVNSDSKILMNLAGKNETVNFSGNTKLFPMEFIQNNSYLDVLNAIPMEISNYIPMVKVVGKFKSKEEILKRALALIFLSSYAEGLNKTVSLEAARVFLFNQIKKFDIASTFSENELNFIFNNKPSENEVLYFSKEYESANILFWIVSMGDVLSFPPAPAFTHELISKTSIFLNFSEINERALLRDEDFILKNYDLNHKVLLSALDNKFSGKTIPPIVSIDILEIREKAFRWATSNLFWDKI